MTANGAAWVSAIATVILGVVTIAYVVVTKQLLDVNVRAATEAEDRRQKRQARNIKVSPSGHGVQGSHQTITISYANEDPELFVVGLRTEIHYFVNGDERSVVHELVDLGPGEKTRDLEVKVEEWFEPFKLTWTASWTDDDTGRRWATTNRKHVHRVPADDREG